MDVRRERIRSLIRTVPDFPKPGIQFRDITTLLRDAAGFQLAIGMLTEHFAGRNLQMVAGIEARGFVVGAALAHALGLGFVPLRKKGRLPGPTLGQAYALEYGADQMEIHSDALAPGVRVLVVDDLLATGGTAEAAIRLVRQSGGVVEAACFLVDLPELGGRPRIEAMGVEVFYLCEFAGP